MTQNVTIFKNILNTETPFFKDVYTILDRVKEGKSKDLVKKIRAERDKEARNVLKKGLPAICFSGTFTKRSDNALEAHSGLICLDFDGYSKNSDMLQAKDAICKDKFVFSAFVSPSGNGLKVLVRIPADVDNHVNYFNSLKNHFSSQYWDDTCKNVSRVCYESYDPLIYVNPNSSLWDVIEEVEYVERLRTRDSLTIPMTDENKIIDRLIKWWTKKYPMGEGVRNANMFIIAMAMNEFGIQKSLALYVLEQYAEAGFGIKEIDRTVESAYASTASFNTKYYEDEEKVNSVRGKIKRGVSKKEVRFQMQEAEVDAAVIDSVLNRVEEENTMETFWSKNEKGVIRIIHILFKNFLENHGFFKFCPQGGKSYVFVKVTNNLVDHTSEKAIKDFILDYLLDLDDMSVYNYFADNTRFFKDEFLTLLSTIDIYFIEDTRDSAYLYYRNCAVRVTKEEVLPIDYVDLGGYVWKDHVINRNFDVCELTKNCDYQRFISTICCSMDDRVASMESTIGFLLHAHKNLSFCPAVILNDEVISDNPEGGTGKGLFMTALSHMKKLVVIDGKAFAFEKSFPYQLVSADTQILCFDDVKRHFDFERLFSAVTEGLTLEKKNKDAIKIPFPKSPKIAITTNYAIKGTGNSFARRKWELELYQYYSQEYTPYDEFGRMLFGDWDDDAWREFDNYMIGCLQGYMNTGLVKSKFVNLKIRQLSAATCHEFIEWCGLLQGQAPNLELINGCKLYKDSLYYAFVREYPDYGERAKMTISRTRFYKWLVEYAMYKEGVPPEDGRDATGRWIIFRTKHDYDEKISYAPKQTEAFEDEDDK